MSYRIYVEIEPQAKRITQEIGTVIINYVQLKTGAEFKAKYYIENRRGVVYMIFKSEEEAQKVYDVLRGNDARQPIGKVTLREGYRTDGKMINLNTTNPWHNRYFENNRHWLEYLLRKDDTKEIGYSFELSRALREMGLTS